MGVAGDLGERGEEWGGGWGMVEGAGTTYGERGDSWLESGGGEEFGGPQCVQSTPLVLHHLRM